MKIRFVLVILSLLVSFAIQAQPSNDNCDTPIYIPDIADYCTDFGEYTNVNATASAYAPPNCFDNAPHEVWFSFTAVASDLTFTVVGAAGQGGGGTLQNPQVALYDNNCGSTVTQLGCAASGSSVTELYVAGLVIGETYLIRIDGENNSTGTFQFCTNNYNPIGEPGGDCISAAVLCDKSSFVIQSVSGAGDDTNEADNTCLDVGGNSESNSTWFVWTAATTGQLTFTLTPLKVTDDLDFAVYELPGGLTDCVNKVSELCMASGDFSNFPSPCMGPTGLSVFASDSEEQAGCNTGDDNFVRPLDMVVGKSYALIVNNFTSTGNGFSIDFGGDGEFQGPQVDMIVSSDPVCVGDPVSFTPTTGQFVSWNWNFGVGAVPQTATGIGTHNVVYSQEGVKVVSLTVESADGCLVTTTSEVTVEECCVPMTLTADITSLLCPPDDIGAGDGAIDVTVNGGTPPFDYFWPTTLDVVEDLDDLEPGDYTIIVTDANYCEVSATYTVTSPPIFSLGINFEQPSCGGGMDGSFSVFVGGGTPPYLYNFNGTGFAGSNGWDNLGEMEIEVVVQDAVGCDFIVYFTLTELELMLNPNNLIQKPSCPGDSDGALTVNMLNGQAPFQYDFNDGMGFGSSNQLLNIPAGTYNVDLLDANGCTGEYYGIVVEDPVPLGANPSAVPVECAGQANGSISAGATGGTLPYSYLWDTPFDQTNGEVFNLPPGEYFLSLTDANGCFYKDSIIVTEPDAVVITDLLVLDNNCFGDNAGAIAVTANGGSRPYTYSVDGISFQADSVLTGLASGSYTVVVRDDFGCDFEGNTTVSEPFEIIVEARYDQLIDLGFTADLQAVVNTSDEHTYTWAPVESLTCNDCASPTAFPFVSTTYYVLVETEKGCLANDSVRVEVNPVRPVFIPNAFSPNFDGVNDAFMIFGGPAVLQVQQFDIYSRWGSLVHRSENHPVNDSSFGWPGTFKGKIMDPGVFVYTATVEFLDGTVVEYAGSLTLLR